MNEEGRLCVTRRVRVRVRVRVKVRARVRVQSSSARTEVLRVLIKINHQSLSSIINAHQRVPRCFASSSRSIINHHHQSSMLISAYRGAPRPHQDQSSIIIINHQCSSARTEVLRVLIGVESEHAEGLVVDAHDANPRQQVA